MGHGSSSSARFSRALVSTCQNGSAGFLLTTTLSASVPSMSQGLGKVVAPGVWLGVMGAWSLRILG